MGGKNWSNAQFLVFEKNDFIIGVSYRQKCDMGNFQRELQTLGPQKSQTKSYTPLLYFNNT